MVIVLSNTTQKSYADIPSPKEKHLMKKQKEMNELYLHMIWQNSLVFLFCLQYTSFLHILDEGCYSISCSVGIQRHKFLSICPRLPNLTIRHSLETEQWWINWHWSKKSDGLKLLTTRSFRSRHSYVLQTLHLMLALSCFHQYYIIVYYSTGYQQGRVTDLGRLPTRLTSES